MDRLYAKLIKEYISDYKKMVFVSGARQVGKTTIAKALIAANPNALYLNWDYPDDKNTILNNHHNLLSKLISTKSDNRPQIVLDEIHKFSDWKNLIKGFYDKFGDQIEFIITGSAKLNVYKKGGDSLMGRYLNVTVHPLSVAEASGDSRQVMERLLQFGGFVEPYLKADPRFHRIWSQQRFEQLFREDIRGGEDINIASLELLATILKEYAGGMISYTNLCNKVRVSDSTIRRWLATLEKYYYSFSIKPWSRNVVKSLIKEPKYYLYDWSQVQNEGLRFENFVASGLLKAVYYWNETGEGVFGLHYLRDKQKREVDFVVTKNNEPWFLVEAKASDENPTSSLHYFYEKIQPEFAFQVVRDMVHTTKKCFEEKGLWVVPATSFLSELV